MSEQREAILAKLVAFDTTSRESNLGLIHYLQDYLTQLGVTSQLIYDRDRRKANLLARLGPAGNGGIMLSGHTDVVPVDGQNWSCPPFTLTRRLGRYYGRGTADMKGFIACVLAALPAFIQQRLRLPLHLAFSYDEEVGCTGVRSLVSHLQASAEKPSLCIVGEPTGMRPVYGHKGKLALRCHVTGFACHSAYAPRGVNAIEYAARVMQKLAETGEQLKKTRDGRFDPPFSTLQIGLIQGGTALNIVPEACQFDFEIRHLPGMDISRTLDQLNDYARQQLVPAMQAIHRDSAIAFSALNDYPGLLTDPQGEFAQWLAQWAGSEAFSTVAFGTEGGLFAQAGIATLVCGPGSMEQGHKPDEFVTIQQLDRCTTMLTHLRQWLGTPAG